MTRDRKRPGIRKPVIDEETALRFATAQQPGSTESIGADTGAPSDQCDDAAGDPSTVRLAVTLSRDTYARIVKEAARKERSVEELLQRHLTKHYGKG